MLFCPPLPPVRLSEAAVNAIGRHGSCEFVLRKEEVSRRHAEIYFEGGVFRIRDLGSTNGTYVDGSRVVGDVTLTRGAKIEIGTSTITFCEMEGDVGAQDDEPSAAKTMIAERLPAASGDALHGDLAEIPPDALLQLLEMGHKSGLLELSPPDGDCRIWLENGYPVHAESEKHLGFDAALVVVASNSGHFRFEPGVISRDRTLTATVTEILLEGVRLRDEADR